MKTHLFPALKLTLLSVVFFSVIYPAVVWGIAQLSPTKGNVAWFEHKGKVVGAKLIGQSFTQDQYFQSRPSAAGYNAASSVGSNKGPTNADYLKEVQARIDTFLVHNPGIQKNQIPADLVTASGSGLDPDISVQGALVQIPRIARIRHISEEQLQQLVKIHTQRSFVGGVETVNVLALNAAL
ncbi:K(+)-transporting ATPase subunit C [Siphonobacter sp. SORGH_AS_0500]|uniref:K(+)-transporting ATPase subunit C n=1 Tax=Siphonobacter sp. SORGH_AS_0500 TaxID=1864824 RepID=UPI00285E68D0|nr:K(+)-transporting ATPase subunit C [Siphonobacter sp. SORGH_AS_0500]MDR6197433.1 K+-transporting ATPase ATPase C chain [Siphonobacter sp. SORGH_AS_0500]